MKKIQIIVIVVFIVAVLSIGLVYMVNQKNSTETINTNNAQDYYMQTWAFHLGVSLPNDTGYNSFDECRTEFLYIDLAYYTKETGEVLTLAEVEEYLSVEYEDDGTLRMYNNGKHPKIQAYVEWRTEGRRDDEVKKYREALNSIYSAYTKETYIDKGLSAPNISLYDLSFQQLDELIKKEADPSYEMQLNLS